MTDIPSNVKGLRPDLNVLLGLSRFQRFRVIKFARKRPMKAIVFYKQSVLGMRALVFLFLFSLLAVDAAVAQTLNPDEPFELRAGVVVDPAASRLFVMRPDGPLDAVGFDGTSLWSTKQAAKPLFVLEPQALRGKPAVRGSVLMALAEKADGAPAAVTGLNVAILDASDGRLRFSDTVETPAGWWTSIDDGLGKSLRTQVRPHNGDAYFFWDVEEQTMNGAAPLPAQGAPGKETAAAAAQQAQRRQAPNKRQTSGTALFDFAGGRVPPVAVASVPRPQPLRPDVPERERLSNVKGVQYLSADGRHVVASTLGFDPSAWEKYEWTVYTFPEGREVGKMTNAFSRADFFVSGTTLVFVSQPYWLRTEGELKQSPLELRAVDLRSGNVLWSRSIRDTDYHGPFPP